MPLPDVIDRALDALIVPSFTSIGYRLRGLEPVTERMDGKRTIITGATSGIGRAAAEQIVALGASLVIVARNEAKALAFRDELVDRHATAVVTIEIADLSLMAEVRALAERLAEGPTIDVLINNAGALFGERAHTDEGVERTLATNLAGHFLLTNTVAKNIAPDGRVINVSSGGAYTQRISVRYLKGEKGYDGTTAYAQTKRGQLILTEMWAERLAPIVVHAMHPGWSDTPGLGESLPMFTKIVGPLFRSAEQGADTMVWLAASAEGGQSTGEFWLDRRPRPFHKTKRTRETAGQRRDLWEFLNQTTST